MCSRATDKVLVVVLHVLALRILKSSRTNLCFKDSRTNLFLPDEKPKKLVFVLRETKKN